MIYLDHHAATPLSPQVSSAIARAHGEGWANPASVHAAGRRARGRLEDSRRALASALSVDAADVVLTGGGTEACNLAVLGLLPAAARLLVTGTEHPAVSGCAARASQAGIEVQTLPPPGHGFVEALERALASGPSRTLVALSWVNHETGDLLPVAECAAICEAHGADLVLDACQAFGKVPVACAGLAAVAVAATKIGGPAGAGAVYFDRKRVPEPVLAGGAQERGRRPGTPDVAAHAGFAAAVAELPERLAAQPRIAAQRDRLEAALVARGCVVNGTQTGRVATVTNVSVPDWRGDMLVAALDVEGLCASAGAACSSGLGAPSPVLQALYPTERWRALSALRLSLGPQTRDDDVTQALVILDRVLSRT